jgi:magnesium transporter
MIGTDQSSDKKQLSMKSVSLGDFTWTDIVQPTKESLKFLSDKYAVNMLDMEDALSPRQVPKIEDYPHYLFCVFHFSVFDRIKRTSSRQQWSAFIGEKFLVTIRPVEFKAPGEMMHECEINQEIREQLLGQGSGYLVYEIIDRSIDRYFKVLDKILNFMEDIEDNVFKEKTEVAIELSFIRRDIITQRRVMFPTRTLMVELEKKLKRFTKNDLTIYFSDLMDHINKICETLDEYTETIEVFNDADYTLSGYRSNRTIRSMGVLIAVTLPFLVVAGLSLILPSSIDKNSNLFFVTMIGIGVVITLIILVTFKHRRII